MSYRFVCTAFDIGEYRGKDEAINLKRLDGGAAPERSNSTLRHSSTRAAGAPGGFFHASLRNRYDVGEGVVSRLKLTSP